MAQAPDAPSGVTATGGDYQNDKAHHIAAACAGDEMPGVLVQIMESVWDHRDLMDDPESFDDTNAAIEQLALRPTGKWIT
ncbi:hypothetical protein ACNPQM_44020 [Streptomyces sp. NPDC056231]|uniref:hypothetical protein n=1 Tax=Streptomyces sp. NPDC056231 TaxID=3345755 RepID=UPI003AAFA1FC